MGFHGVDILYLYLELDGFNTLDFPTVVGFLLFVWLLCGVLFSVNIRYFKLLQGVGREMQQACLFCTSRPIAWMA